MRLTKPQWFNCVSLVYSVIISLMVIVDNMKHNVSVRNYIFIPIFIIIALIPLFVINFLAKNLPRALQTVYFYWLIIINVTIMLPAIFINLFMVSDAQIGIVLYMIPFVMTCVNIMVFILCCFVDWAVGSKNSSMGESDE